MFLELTFLLKRSFSRYSRCQSRAFSSLLGPSRSSSVTLQFQIWSFFLKIAYNFKPKFKVVQQLQASCSDNFHDTINNWFMLQRALSSYGALGKLELPSATPRATLTLLSCSPNFPLSWTLLGLYGKYHTSVSLYGPRCVRSVLLRPQSDIFRADPALG